MDPGHLDKASHDEVTKLIIDPNVFYSDKTDIDLIETFLIPTSNLQLTLVQ